MFNRKNLVAITAGMSVGCCFHDYSMATLVRDKRNLGHVLTKTVADLLKTCGFKIWYWGYKTGYMQQYDHYGGRLLVLVQPHSAAAERVFSLVTNRFAPAGGSASTLASWIRLSCMLKINDRTV